MQKYVARLKDSGPGERFPETQPVLFVRETRDFSKGGGGLTYRKSKILSFVIHEGAGEGGEA